MSYSKNSYYDQDGNIITFREWLELFDDKKERHVGNEKINGYQISTIWVGLDFNFEQGEPLIFETMIFPEENKIPELSHYQKRYSTLEEAKKGHKKACELVKRLTK